MVKFVFLLEIRDPEMVCCASDFEYDTQWAIGPMATSTGFSDLFFWVIIDDFCANSALFAFVPLVAHWHRH